MSTNSQFAVATHILTLLAAVAPAPLTSQTIGRKSVNTNPVVVRRVLGLLLRAGMVASQPGVGGGWRLARQPEALTLRDIYHAVGSGPLLALHAQPPDPGCPVGRHIQPALAEAFAVAESALESALAAQTIAHILQRVRAPAAQNASG